MAMTRRTCRAVMLLLLVIHTLHVLSVHGAPVRRNHDGFDHHESGSGKGLALVPSEPHLRYPNNSQQKRTESSMNTSTHAAAAAPETCFSDSECNSRLDQAMINLGERSYCRVSARWTGTNLFVSPQGPWPRGDRRTPWPHTEPLEWKGTCVPEPPGLTGCGTNNTERIYGRQDHDTCYSSCGVPANSAKPGEACSSARCIISVYECEELGLAKQGFHCKDLLAMASSCQLGAVHATPPEQATLGYCQVCGRQSATAPTTQAPSVSSRQWRWRI